MIAVVGVADIELRGPDDPDDGREAVARGTSQSIHGPVRSSYRRAIESPRAMNARATAAIARVRPLYSSAITTNGTSWLAGVAASKNGSSGVARRSRSWTSANRIVPEQQERRRVAASGWRARSAAGNRIAATAGKTCRP